jgi:hypothetical protein
MVDSRRFNAPNCLKCADLEKENERLKSLVVSLASGGVVALCDQGEMSGTVVSAERLLGFPS